MIPLSVVTQGLSKTTITVSESSNNGLNLYDYYRRKLNKAPSSNESVEFIVLSTVTIIGATPDVAAVIPGAGWSSGNKLTLINHGSIIGRGGVGGKSMDIDFVRMMAVDGLSYNPNITISMATNPNYRYAKAADYIIDPKPGGAGGDGISGNITVYNYGTIAGGGGGGGGAGGYVPLPTTTYPTIPLGYIVSSTLFTPSGNGCGGGAPFGKATLNSSTIEGLSEIVGHDLSQYVKPLSGYNIHLQTQISTNTYAGKYRYPDPNIIEKVPNHYAVRVDTRDSRVNTPDHKNVAIYHNAPSVSVVPASEFNFNFPYKESMHGGFAYNYLPGHSGDDYITYHGDIGYGLRRDNISLQSMLEDGQFTKSYKAKDGDRFNGGRGGSDHWSNRNNRVFWYGLRPFSPARRWRFTRAIKVMPPTLQAHRTWYGNGYTNNGTAWNNSNYTYPINYYEDSKGGDGGSIGEYGFRGSMPPKVFISTPMKDNPAYGEKEDVRIYDTSIVPALIYEDRLPANGGRPGSAATKEVKVIHGDNSVFKGWDGVNRD